jgi:hypothetical protein
VDSVCFACVWRSREEEWYDTCVKRAWTAMYKGMEDGFCDASH